MKEFIIHIICLLGLIFGLSGCEHDIDLSVQQDNTHELPAEKVQLEIFTRANSYHLPSTRGNENAVDMTPWVLVFKGTGTNATFVEAVKAFELVGKRYVVLTKQTDGSKYQLLILANPLNNRFYYGNALTGYELNTENLLSKLAVGTTTLSEACEKLLTEPLDVPVLGTVPFSGTDENIPMSYLLEVDKIDNTLKIESSEGGSLLLTRTVAKMIIVNKASDFELKGIMAVVNVPRQGRLHNSDNFVTGNTSNLTEYQHDALYSSPLIIADPVSGGQSTELHPIYVYESCKQDEMSVIIQGMYQGRTYYYKMAIVDNGVQPIDLIRNCAYTFTINRVKGPGYDTVEDAKVSKASNMGLDYTILVDDSDSYEIIANNDYYLGVSNSVFIAYVTSENQERYEAFKIITDCEVNFPDSRNITDNSGQVGGNLSLFAPADGKIPIVGSSTSNPRITPVEVNIGSQLMQYEEGGDGGFNVNAYITLKLGNLEKQVWIRQRNVIPAAGATLKYMPVGSTPAEEYEVNYYCLSAYVDDSTNEARKWIKLRPSTGVKREDTDHITVDDGKIFIEILANTSSISRSGVVYLATIRNPGSSAGSNTIQRVKINITQKGRIINVN